MSMGTQHIIGIMEMQEEGKFGVVYGILAQILYK